MGTNRRYAADVDRRMDARVAERIMRSSTPLSLGDDELELELDVYDLTRTRNPKPVRAWVRYRDGPLRVEAEAHAWTERAVAIEWAGPDNAPHRAWVWASAVEARPRLPREA